MNLTLHIPDEAVPALKAKVSGLPLGTFAEHLLLELIHDKSMLTPDSVADAARRLGTFDKRHDDQGAARREQAVICSKLAGR